MTTATARAAVKNRLGIKSGDTTWDTLIDDFVAAAVLRLYPSASLEVDRIETSSISIDDYGECEIDITALSTSLRAARQAEAWDGFTWQGVTGLFHHGKYLRLRDLSTSTTKIRIYGLKPFGTIDNVYDWLTQAVVWFAMAEFYDYLAGSQSDYNVYMQTTGARAVDNMRDESAYFDQKAIDYIANQGRT